MPFLGRSVPLIIYLVAFALALALPIASYAVYATLAFAGAERQRLEQEARDLTHDLLRKVDREHSSQIAVLEALATSPTLETNDFATFDRQAKNLAVKSDYQVALIGLDGIYITNTNYPFNAPNIPRSSQVAEYFRESSINKIRVIGLYRGARTGRALTATAIPIFQNNLETRIIALITESFKFQSLLDEQAIRKPYYATILDKSNKVVARSENFESYLGLEPPGVNYGLGLRVGGREGTSRAFLSSRFTRLHSCPAGASTFPSIRLRLPPRLTEASGKWV